LALSLIPKEARPFSITNGIDDKQKDKEEAQKYKHVHTAIFDFETVLPTPYSLVNQAYYNRTLHLPFYCIPLVIEKGRASFGMRLRANEHLVR
jgi:hypothetical protein